MNLTELSNYWDDLPEVHKDINEMLIDEVNNTPELKAHRDWVERNVFGFGERSFLQLHKLLVDEMPENFTFAEIGVFRGQILSLYRLLADLQGKNVTRYGITPLDSSDGHWESDYEQDVKTIHEAFNLEKDYTIFKGLSTDLKILKSAIYASPYDILYIDGGHDYATVKFDLENYAPLVKTGGYLVIDDSCCDMSMPFGFFQGISDVTKATVEYMNGNSDWEFIVSVVHNRVFRRL